MRAIGGQIYECALPLGSPTMPRSQCPVVAFEAVASPTVSVGSERGQMSGHGNSGEFFFLLALTWTDSLTLTGEGGSSVPLCYLISSEAPCEEMEVPSLV